MKFLTHSQSSSSERNRKTDRVIKPARAIGDAVSSIKLTVRLCQGENEKGDLLQATAHERRVTAASIFSVSTVIALAPSKMTDEMRTHLHLRKRRSFARSSRPACLHELPERCWAVCRRGRPATETSQFAQAQRKCRFASVKCCSNKQHQSERKF